MLAGIKDFVIISNPNEKHVFQELFKDAEKTMGIKIHFSVQDKPRGIADAFNIVGTIPHKELNLDQFDRVALILGDNIFYGAAMSAILQMAVNDSKAVVFATPVHDPERFGVVQVGDNDTAISLEEKPKEPKSNLAVTGLYFYPKNVFEYAYRLKPSHRAELEITDLNKMYMESAELRVVKLLRGMIWFDTGTPDSLMEAAQFVQTIQKLQTVMVGSPHEVAFSNKWIDDIALHRTARLCSKTAYGKYLLSLLEEQ
jgi:glucose-1-phosphate thymidylyltransferase